MISNGPPAQSMISVPLTLAQRSALECAGLDTLDETRPAEALLATAIRTNRLVFDPADRDGLVEALTDCANSEDASAQQGDRFAARAASALTNLVAKVRRAEQR